MESKRLKLTPPSLEYADSMWAIIQESEAELAEFLPWVSESLTLNKLKDNIEFAAKNYDNFSDDFWFNVFEKRSGALIGAVGFIVRDPDVPYFEIGYWLSTAMVGKGYISEAVNIVERFAFIDNKAHRVEIKMAGSNVKSRAVAERCGYQLEAKLDNGRRLVSGELDSTVIYVKTAL
ncbi:GNAT family N-acetyltransferase [Photobacterium sanguinicancri]|uniref:GNAT family N-acetyltransferase n=1 Tax=Photobacterium sanguinicancri TaxID=875932 RepID=A0AAW7Y9Y5_9GAMM|nr:GNAT family N-acetyltransferase [Photobacterium sanguinicancri]MDO6545412.1 GNAT family N-acetyltransferase [Photobacterium sanguinicancri]